MFSETTAVLITKEEEYPANVLYHVKQFPFRDIVMEVKCPGVWRRFEIAKEVETPLVYVQDDDAICPIGELMEEASMEGLTLAMSSTHIRNYRHLKCALIGHGAVFPKGMVGVMDKYLEKWPRDRVFELGADRIFTALNFPLQRRLCLRVTDLPTAVNPDRMSFMPDHYWIRAESEKRCESVC